MKELVEDLKIANDNLYSANKMLEKEIERLNRECDTYLKIANKRKNRIDKATEYLEQPYRDNFDYSKAELLNILNGSDKDE